MIRRTSLQLVNWWTGFVTRSMRLSKSRHQLTTFKVVLLAFALPCFAVEQSDYYTTHSYDLPQGLILEASGLAVLPDGKLAIGIRRGEVWIIDDPTNDKPSFHKFASGMHTKCLVWSIMTVPSTPRSAPKSPACATTNNDGVADEYLTAATGWGVSGNYHEYAYGPVFR